MIWGDWGCLQTGDQRRALEKLSEIDLFGTSQKKFGRF
jgi:hypothetical protein